MRAKPLYLEGMNGLGDAIYQHPVVKRLAAFQDVYLKTSWPQIYEGLSGVFCVKPETRFRTQKKNIQTYEKWMTVPPATIRMALTYVDRLNKGIPIADALAQCVGLLPGNFKYHLQLREKVESRSNIAIIRPPTLRSEWYAASRNPKMEYIQHAINFLNAKGLETWVVADIQPPEEIYDGVRPAGAARYFEHGELRLPELLEAVHQARIVVGGVGFIVPMCIGMGTPTVVVHGGMGGLNSPHLIDAPGLGDPLHVLPKEYCFCRNHRHACKKTIDLVSLEKTIEAALS